jgi:hypothetical protein
MSARLLLAIVLSAAMTTAVGAQQRPAPDQASQSNPAEELFRANQEDHDPDHFLHEVDDALGAIPLAAILGAVLAMRPRRKGTPKRQASVIQTQIILAMVGAVVMLIVGQSLARAFGIVGVASLIRYRAKIDDPKDAVVMLCCLGVGLASGVGLYALAIVTTVFVLVVLFLLESFEPETKKLFDVSIKSKKDIRGPVEQIFKRAMIEYELRSMSDEELVYEVRMPFKRRTDKISTAIIALDSSNETAVEWKEKKAAKTV